VEEVRILVQEAIDRMGAEVDGATGSVRDVASHFEQLNLPCAIAWFERIACFILLRPCGKQEAKPAQQDDSEHCFGEMS
jgi:hypothetical protein